jgi:hypothetical protein
VQSSAKASCAAAIALATHIEAMRTTSTHEGLRRHVDDARRLRKIGD